MDRCVVRIERLNNGFEVEMTDPAIVEYNNKRDNSKAGIYKPWKDPKVSYAFKTVKEVVAFLEKNLEKAMPIDDEYGSAFDAAVAEDDD